MARNPGAKPRKEKSDRDYIDDIKLTKLLLKEIDERDRGERKGPSNELGEAFLLIFNKINTSWKYIGYSQDWKQDFLSKASYLFVRHWYKFKPERAQKNWYQKDGKKYIKEENEWGGAHGYFTLFCITAIHDVIRKKKEDKLKNKKMMSIENKNLGYNLKYY